MIRYRRSITTRTALVALLAAVVAFPAAPQTLPDLPRPGERGKAPPRGPVDEHPTPSLPTAARIPWPRLDPGAVLCRTRDDLRLQADVIQARASGQPYAGAAPNCRIIASTVAIDIVNRESPSATEVKLREPPGNSGWTSTWLPSTPPR